MKLIHFVLPMCLAWALPAYANGARPLDVDHFDYCAPPVRPACVSNPLTFQTPRLIVACNGEMQRFVSYVSLYRECKYGEIEKVLRRTNAAVSLFKCRAAHQLHCSSGSGTDAVKAGGSTTTSPAKKSIRGTDF